MGLVFPTSANTWLERGEKLKNSCGGESIKQLGVKTFDEIVSPSSHIKLISLFYKRANPLLFNFYFSQKHNSCTIGDGFL